MHWVTSEHVVAAAESVSALLTGGALVVSARLLRREAKRDRQRETSAIRDQANRVSAFMRIEDHTVSRFPVPPLQLVTGYVLNASELPVYDVAVTFAVGDPSDEEAKTATRDVGFVAPHGEIPFDSDELQGRIVSAQALPVSFRDSAGRRWFRDGSGTLFPWSQDLLTNHVRWWPNGIVESPTTGERGWMQEIRKRLRRAEAPAVASSEAAE